MLDVTVKTVPTCTAGTPTLLFEGKYVTNVRSPASYDVSIDGQRFLMMKAEGRGPEIHVVLNWFEELKRLVPSDN